MAEVASKPLVRLGLIAALFDALHENEVMYCHWKSNEHLGASMVGNTDLDVLFDPSQKVKLESILESLGFKRFDAITQKQYKGIVDFVGLDAESGKVVHVHTHYILTMGEPYLKGYRFAIEDHALASRVFNDNYGLYCIDPVLELILLFVRESLKLRHRDLLPEWMRRSAQSRQPVLREHAWLKARTTESDIYTVLSTIFENYPAIYAVITGGFEARQLLTLSSLVKKEAKVIRSYSPSRALLCRWYREASILASRKLALALNQPVLFKRNNPRRGIAVAVIGADGSGKSTVTESLRNTFGEKLDVFKIYFGRGDGRSSTARKLLVSLKPAGKNRAGNTGDDPANKKASFLRTFYKSLEALFVAEEKRMGMNLMRKARAKGALVICDRYPQDQILGYNDGPLFHRFMNSKNPWLRFVARREAGIYAQAGIHLPDIIFKLVTDPEVSERRKPGENSPEKLRAKITGINQLKFDSKCKVIAVDATKPLNEVLYIIKKEIWNVL